MSKLATDDCGMLIQFLAVSVSGNKVFYHITMGSLGHFAVRIERYVSQKFIFVTHLCGSVKRKCIYRPPHIKVTLAYDP